MKKLIAAACCVLLAGCAAIGTSRETGGIDAMEGDGQSYVPATVGSYEPLPAEERLTTSCTMKGKNVQCF